MSTEDKPLPSNPMPLQPLGPSAAMGGGIGYLMGRALKRAKIGTAAGVVGGLAGGAAANHAIRKHNEEFFNHPYAVAKVLPKSGLSTHMNLQNKYGVDTLRIRYNADTSK